MKDLTQMTPAEIEHWAEIETQDLVEKCAAMTPPNPVLTDLVKTGLKVAYLRGAHSYSRLANRPEALA